MTVWFRTFICLTGILLLPISLIITFSQSTREFIGIQFYFEEDSLTLVVSEDYLLAVSEGHSLSLEGLSFRVSRNRIPVQILLINYPAFNIVLDNVTNPICYRLKLPNSIFPLPMVCQQRDVDYKIITQILGTSDIFWYDAPQYYPVIIYKDDEELGTCTLGAQDCLIYYPIDVNQVVIEHTQTAEALLTETAFVTQVPIISVSATMTPAPNITSTYTHTPMPPVISDTPVYASTPTVIIASPIVPIKTPDPLYTFEIAGMNLRYTPLIIRDEYSLWCGSDCIEAPPEGWAPLDLPMTGIRIERAIAYCEHIGFRLPLLSEFINSASYDIQGENSDVWQWVGGENNQNRLRKWGINSQEKIVEDSQTGYTALDIGFRCVQDI